MKRILLLFMIFPVYQGYAKPHYCRPDWYQQIQINELKDELARIKLQAVVQTKIAAIQKIAHEMQLKNELQYYQMNTLVYKQDLRKLLSGITELASFRWNLFANQINGNFIGCSIMSGACAVVTMFLIGASIAKKDFFQYAVPSTILAGLSGILGIFGAGYYSQAQMIKDTSEKLRNSLDSYLALFDFYKTFNKYEVVTDYYQYLTQDVVIALSFESCQNNALIDKINQDRVAVLQ